MAKKAPPARAKRARTMTDEHKAALAEGREQGRAVKRYLEALESQRPKRGRKRSPASMEKRLAEVDQRLATADPLSRLHLEQERHDLEQELKGTQDGGVDMAALEEEFISVAAAYGERKGISYSTWRTVGVEARVLRAAGIGRAS